MEAFGGAKRVEDFDMEALTKAFEESCREGFAGGNSVANAGEIEIGAVGTMVVEQRGIICGHGEEERGAIALDMGVNAFGSRARGREDRGGTTGEGEVAGVAKAIGEKQPGYAEASIAFGDFEDGAGIVMRANDHVVMEVHAAFGNACGAGGVEPERGVIFGGGRGGEFGRR